MQPQGITSICAAEVDLGMNNSLRVAIAHDYLTQKGGAERVVLSLLRAFPGAPLYTLLYNPETTFDQFRQFDIRTSRVNSFKVFQRDHRVALPLLPFAAERLKVNADLVVASTSGWAHGFDAGDGTVVAYCHSPARWLYQRDRYLGGSTPAFRRFGSSILHFPLLAWDRKSAARVHQYIANSTIVRERIEQTYGRQATVIPAPVSLPTADMGTRPAAYYPSRTQDGFYLCVSRLLPYKNVMRVLEGCRKVGVPLVIVGQGPEFDSLKAAADGSAQVLSDLTDSEMAWLYENCTAVVAASYEDFGLTPLEGALHGKPTVALRFGGYLDTILEGRTGVFFDEPTAPAIADAIEESRRIPWSTKVIRDRAAEFSEERFISRIRDTAFQAVEARIRLAS